MADHPTTTPLVTCSSAQLPQHAPARPTISISPEISLDSKPVPPTDIGLPAVGDGVSTASDSTLYSEEDSSTVENAASSIDGTSPKSVSAPPDDFDLAGKGFQDLTSPTTASVKGKERSTELEFSAITQHGPFNLDKLAMLANLATMESTATIPTHSVTPHWTSINESHSNTPQIRRNPLRPSQWLKVLAWNPDNLEPLSSPPDSFSRLNAAYDRHKEKATGKIYWNEQKFHAILRTYYTYLWYHYQDGPAKQFVMEALDIFTDILIADMNCTVAGYPASIERFLQLQGDKKVDVFEDRLCVTLEERFQALEKEINVKFFGRESVRSTAKTLEPYAYSEATDPAAVQVAHIISKLSRGELSEDPLCQTSQRPRRRLPDSPRPSKQPEKRSNVVLPTSRPAKRPRTSLATSTSSASLAGSSSTAASPISPSSSSSLSGPSAAGPTIISLDRSRPALVPASILAFNPSGPFPDTDPTVRDVASWMPFLKALGLTPGVFPAIQVIGKKAQTGKKRPRNQGTQPPAWNFLIYVILAVVPGGRLKLKPLYNLCLAWCSGLSPKNESCRHSLTTKEEFINEKDGEKDLDDKDADENNKGWWRLANVGEEKPKKVAKAATRKQRPPNQGARKGVDGNGSFENGGPGPQTAANRKAKATKVKGHGSEQEGQGEKDAMEGVEFQEQQIQEMLEEEEPSSSPVETSMVTTEPQINKPLGIGSLTERSYAEPELGHDALLARKDSKRFGNLDAKAVHALGLVPEDLKDEPPAKRLRRRPNQYQ